MKFNPLTIVLFSGLSAALEGAKSPSLSTRSTLCSLGIGRVIDRIYWDVTIYNVPASERQDINIVTTAKSQMMDKGQSITVNGITITNVDNAPVFPYNTATISAPLAAPTNGYTKVDLTFEMGGTKWNTSDCSAGNVIWAGGRESWSCDFECGSEQVAREL